MEVSAGDDRLVLREEEGVVGDGVELDIHLGLDKLQRVPYGPVDLGDTAQGVGVLNPGVLAVAQDLAALCQQADVLRHLDLPDLSPDRVHPLLKSVQLSGEGGEGHGGHQVRKLGRLDGVVEVQCPHAGHGAGAVGHAQALLAHQGLQGGEARTLHGLRAGEDLALVDGLAPAQEHQAHVGQGRQIAGGPQGALLGHHGDDAPVEHLHQELHQDGAHAADAHAQRVGPQEHHAPDHLFGVGFAGGSAVAEDQVGGQAAAHLLRHRHGGEVAKAGGDAVGHPVLPRDLLRQGPGAGHGLPGLLRQLHGRAVPGRRYKGFKGQAVAVQGHGLDVFGMSHDIFVLLPQKSMVFDLPMETGYHRTPVKSTNRR